MGYTIIAIEKQNNDLAIKKFEKTFPDLVWRRFEEVGDRLSVFNSKY